MLPEIQTLTNLPERKKSKNIDVNKLFILAIFMIIMLVKYILNKMNRIRKKQGFLF